jgi:hypothetical protein
MSILSTTCGVFNTELYSLRGQLLTAYIMLGLSEKAFEVCNCCCSYLLVCLHGSLPDHPLLGLQLFTLGDLAQSIGKCSYALDVYKLALDVLSVTCSLDSDLLLRLQESIDSINGGKK